MESVENRKVVYEYIKDKVTDFKDFDDFNQQMDDESNARVVYDYIKDDVTDFKDFGDFQQQMKKESVVEPQPQQETVQTPQQTPAAGVTQSATMPEMTEEEHEQTRKIYDILQSAGGITDVEGAEQGTYFVGAKSYDQFVHDLMDPKQNKVIQNAIAAYNKQYMATIGYTKEHAMSQQREVDFLLKRRLYSELNTELKQRIANQAIKFPRGVYDDSARMTDIVYAINPTENDGWYMRKDGSIFWQNPDRNNILSAKEELRNRMYTIDADGKLVAGRGKKVMDDIVANIDAKDPEIKSKAIEMWQKQMGFEDGHFITDYEAAHYTDDMSHRGEVDKYVNEKNAELVSNGKPVMSTEEEMQYRKDVYFTLLNNNRRNYLWNLYISQSQLKNKLEEDMAKEADARLEKYQAQADKEIDSHNEIAMMTGGAYNPTQAIKNINAKYDPEKNAMEETMENYLKRLSLIYAEDPDALQKAYYEEYQKLYDHLVRKGYSSNALSYIFAGALKDNFLVEAVQNTTMTQFQRELRDAAKATDPLNNNLVLRGARGVLSFASEAPLYGAMGRVASFLTGKMMQGIVAGAGRVPGMGRQFVAESTQFLISQGYTAEKSREIAMRTYRIALQQSNAMKYAVTPVLSAAQEALTFGNADAVKTLTLNVSEGNPWIDEVPEGTIEKDENGNISFHHNTGIWNNTYAAWVKGNCIGGAMGIWKPYISMATTGRGGVVKTLGNMTAFGTGVASMATVDYLSMSVRHFENPLDGKTTMEQYLLNSSREALIKERKRREMASEAPMTEDEELAFQEQYMAKDTDNPFGISALKCKHFWTLLVDNAAMLAGFHAKGAGKFLFSHKYTRADIHDAIAYENAIRKHQGKPLLTVSEENEIVKQYVDRNGQMRSVWDFTPSEVIENIKTNMRNLKAQGAYEKAMMFTDSDVQLLKSKNPEVIKALTDISRSLEAPATMHDAKAMANIVDAIYKMASDNSIPQNLLSKVLYRMSGQIYSPGLISNAEMRVEDGRFSIISTSPDGRLLDRQYYKTQEEAEKALADLQPQIEYSLFTRDLNALQHVEVMINFERWIKEAYDACKNKASEDLTDYEKSVANVFVQMYGKGKEENVGFANIMQSEHFRNVYVNMLEKCDTVNRLYQQVADVKGVTVEQVKEAIEGHDYNDAKQLDVKCENIGNGRYRTKHEQEIYNDVRKVFSDANTMAKTILKPEKTTTDALKEEATNFLNTKSPLPLYNRAVMEMEMAKEKLTEMGIEEENYLKVASDVTMNQEVREHAQRYLNAKERADASMSAAEEEVQRLLDERKRMYDVIENYSTGEDSTPMGKVITAEYDGQTVYVTQGYPEESGTFVHLKDSEGNPITFKAPKGDGTMIESEEIPADRVKMISEMTKSDAMNAEEQAVRESINRKMEEAEKGFLAINETFKDKDGNDLTVMQISADPQTQQQVATISDAEGKLSVVGIDEAKQMRKEGIRKQIETELMAQKTRQLINEEREQARQEQEAEIPEANIPVMGTDGWIRNSEDNSINYDEMLKLDISNVYDSIKMQGMEPRELVMQSLHNVGKEIEKLKNQKYSDLDPSQMIAARQETQRKLDNLYQQQKFLRKLADESGKRQDADEKFFGLVDSAESLSFRSQSPEWADYYDQLAKTFGIKLKFRYGLTREEEVIKDGKPVLGEDGKPLRRMVEVNGKNELGSNVIWINYKDKMWDITPDDVQLTTIDYFNHVIGHELTHSLFKADRDSMNQFVDLVKDYLGEDRFNELKAMESVGNPDEEVACNMAGQLLGEKAFRQKLVKDVENTIGDLDDVIDNANEIYTWVHNIVTSIKRMLDIKTDEKSAVTKEKDAILADMQDIFVKVLNGIRNTSDMAIAAKYKVPDEPAEITAERERIDNDVHTIFAKPSDKWEEAARIAFEGYPEALLAFDDIDIPRTVKEYASRISNHTLSYEDVKKECGGDWEDWGRLRSLFKKDGGLTINELAHQMWENQDTKRWDDTEIKNAIIDVLTESRKGAKDLRETILRSRVEEARDIVHEMLDRYVLSLAEQGEIPEGNDGIVPDLPFSIRINEPPLEQVDVYKLMRLLPESTLENPVLETLFIGREKYHMKTWYDAESPKISDLENLPENFAYLIDAEGNAIDKTPIMRVKVKKSWRTKGLPSLSKVRKANEDGTRWITIYNNANGRRTYHNVGINGADGVTEYAMRPGIHAASLPSMEQIGSGTTRDKRDDNLVWVKGKMAYGNGAPEEAEANDGEINTHIPVDGGYKKATSSFVNDGFDWYISGAFMPERIISDDEARDIIDAHNASLPEGVEKIPYDYERKSGLKFYADTMQLEEDRAVRERKEMDKKTLELKDVNDEKLHDNNNINDVDPEKNIVNINKDGEFVSSVSNDGSESMYSVRTYELEGRKNLRDYLDSQVEKDKLTAEEAEVIAARMDSLYTYAKKVYASGEFDTFNTWSYAPVMQTRNGDVIYTVIKPNAEYGMNLDFSLVCKKRRTLDAVLNEMTERNLIDLLPSSNDDISLAIINDIIRSYGFETACKLCFVDAKRFRQAKVADDFVQLYNGLVNSLIPRGSTIKANYFDFSGEGRPTVDAEIALENMDDADVNLEVLKRTIKDNGKKTVMHKIAKYLLNNPSERKLLQRSDFMGSKGFDAVTKYSIEKGAEIDARNKAAGKAVTEEKSIRGLYNSKKGSGGPKSSESDVQYLNDVAKANWSPEKAFAVGGVRVQSFSDFVPHMVFDYVQMFAELAAGKLPAHAYTKEELFVKMFGKTGIKINMSLVPKVVADGIAPGLDKEGNYVWDINRYKNGDIIQAESFDYDEAVKIMNDPAYRNNCGTIAVGISDEHIRKMMLDPNIRMIIPYHASGINKKVAIHNAIDVFVDYTKCQNTRYASTGKKLSKADHAKEKGFNVYLKECGDPVKAVDAYLADCAKKNWIPKFDRFLNKRYNEFGKYKDENGRYDYEQTEGYYKLLEDYTTYIPDGKGGFEYHPQEALRFELPTSKDSFGSFEELMRRGLKEGEIVSEKRRKEVKPIVDELERRLKEKGNLFAAKEYRETKNSQRIEQQEPNEPSFKPGDDMSDYALKKKAFDTWKESTPESDEMFDETYSIRTFHGSAADFDKFDHSFIGSGEGAQVFGWGTYVSSLEEIGLHYADAVTKSKFGPKQSGWGKDGVVYRMGDNDSEFSYIETVAIRSLQRCKDNFDDAIEALTEIIDNNKRIIERDKDDETLKSFVDARRKRNEEAEEVIKIIEDIRDEKSDIAYLQAKDIKRHLYQVDIPDDEGNNYLDWDGKISAEQVKEYVARIRKAMADKYPEQLESVGWKDLEAFASKGEETKGNAIWRCVKQILRDEKETSLLLSDAGFTGIKVSTNFSHTGQHKDTKNYVIFKEGDMEIVAHDKYSERVKKQEEQIRSFNFKDWFGDWENDPENASKVVDEDGKPLVVYHATNMGDFTIFEHGHGDTTNSIADIGFWFSPVESFGDYFLTQDWRGNRDGRRKMAVYLDMKNPKIYESRGEMPKELEEKYTELFNEKIKIEDNYIRGAYIIPDERGYFAALYHGDKEAQVFWREGVWKPERVETAVERYKKIEEQLNESKEEYDKYIYGDAYEQFRTDIYKQVGKDAETANVSGTGMHLDNMEEAKRKYMEMLASEGYDGIIIKSTRYDAKSAGGANDQYVVFDPTQIKSATDNNGDFSRENPDIRYSSRQMDEDYMKAVKGGEISILQQMVDYAATLAGYTVAGYHGTTNRFFVFDKNRANAEGNWGKGFYFTNNIDDVEENYANNNGPDLTNRIEMLAESMEWTDGYEDMSYEDRLEAARKQISEGDPHTLESYLKVQNPVIIGGKGETFFDMDYPLGEDGEYDYDQEPEGNLVEFIEHLKDIVWGSPHRCDVSELYEYGEGGLTASQLESKARELLDFGGYMDEDGNLASGEAIREAFERMGYDGIIDNNVSKKFSSMNGMDAGTVHTIVFKPEQIKLSDPITYDNEGNVIPLSQRFDLNNKDIRYSIRGKKGASEEQLKDLEVAEMMLDEGKTPLAIKKATGWEKGVDGLWRYEMSDGDFSVSFPELNRKLRTVKDTVLLSEIWSDESLFEAYPDLKNVVVGKLSNQNSFMGEQYRNNINIRLNRMPDEVRKTMIHEIQHFIQDKEGFAEGGTPDTRFKVLADLAEKQDEEAGKIGRRLDKKYNKTLGVNLKYASVSSFKFDVEKLSNAKNILLLVKDAMEKYPEFFEGITLKEMRALRDIWYGYENLENRLKKVYNVDDDEVLSHPVTMAMLALKNRDDYRLNALPTNVAEAEKMLNDITALADKINNALGKWHKQWQKFGMEDFRYRGALGYEGYRKLAGEVESRNAAKRAEFTDKQRRNTLLSKTEDVKRKDQLIRFDESLSKANGIKYSGRDNFTRAKAITTFSGGGLVEMGLKGLIQPLAAVEYDKRIIPTYRVNHGGRVVTDQIYKDSKGGAYIIFDGIQNVDLVKLREALDTDEVDYLHGSPVCKNYSTSKVGGEETELDIVTANGYRDFIDEFRPKVVTVENVAGYRDSAALNSIKDTLEENNYIWDEGVYTTSDFGGNTSRKRYILRAVRGKNNTLPPIPAHKKAGSWWNAVKDLVADAPVTHLPDSEIKHLEEMGIDWQNLDTPILVGSNGHGKARVRKYGEPSFTILAGGSEWVVMPGGEVHEATPRMLARITGLPDSYVLPKEKTLAHTIIGNGVPTHLTEALIAPVIKKFVTMPPYKVEITPETEQRYREAVLAGDNEKVEEMFDLYVMQNMDDNIVPFMAPLRYVGKARSVAHQMKGENVDGTPCGKNTQKSAINEAAYQMSKLVPEDAVLVPIPSHTGKATDTRKLAEAISEITGVPVLDALEGLNRESAYSKKKKGGKMTQEYMGIRWKMDCRKPRGKKIIYVDNVIDSGNTAMAAVRAGKGGVVLAYSWTGKAKNVRLKSAIAATHDNEGKLIPLSKRFGAQTTDVRYSDRISGHDPFYSNAAKALEAIKQNKATGDQWLSMLKKNGGLKAEEDKWIGLTDYLHNKKSVTRDEIEDYIEQNAVKVEEVKYGGLEANHNHLVYRDDILTENFLEEGKIEVGDVVYTTDNDDFSASFFVKRLDGTCDVYVYDEKTDSGLSQEDAERKVFAFYGQAHPSDVEEKIENMNFVHPTRLINTTEGLTNKHEIALTVPSIEPYNAGDEVHFGDAGEGRAVAWIRFGDANDADGNNILVIDEIQSKRHQDGREKGYEVDTYDESQYETRQIDDFGGKKTWIVKDKSTGKEDKVGSVEIFPTAKDAILFHINYASNKVPDAPFQKNWHELAMKRMLRYAAENGYDKVAWTTGMQQAERYDLGGVVKSIYADHDNYDGNPHKYVSIYLNGGGNIIFDVNKDGIIESSEIAPTEYDGKLLSEVIGKELADKIVNLPQDQHGIEFGQQDLRLGGEGMKGFYDQMLPRFMDKYGKKWGVKTDTIELDLPNEADRVMHSVDVTDAMRESVMDGQPMFSTRKTNGKESKVSDNSLFDEEGRFVAPNSPKRKRRVENQDTMTPPTDMFSSLTVDESRRKAEGKPKDDDRYVPVAEGGQGYQTEEDAAKEAEEKKNHPVLVKGHKDDNGVWSPTIYREAPEIDDAGKVYIYLNNDSGIKVQRRIIRNTQKYLGGRIGDATRQAFFAGDGEIYGKVQDYSKAEYIGRTMANVLRDYTFVLDDAKKRYLEEHPEADIYSVEEVFKSEMDEIDKAITWYKDFAGGENDRLGDHDGIMYSDRRAESKRTDAREKVIAEIKETIDSKMANAMQKSDLNRLLARVHHATSGNLHNTIEEVMETVGDIKTRMYGQQLYRALALKTQDVNGRNMSIAKNVSNDVRTIVNNVKDKMYGIMVTEEDDLISQMRSENRRLSEENRRTNLALNTNAGSIPMGQYNKMVQSVRENEVKMEENRDHIRRLETERDKTVQKNLKAFGDDIAKQIEDKLAYMDECVDPTTDKTWTQEDSVELTTLEILRDRKDIEDIDQEIRKLRKEKAQSTVMDVIRSYDVQIRDLKRQRLNAVINLSNKVNDVIEGGKASLLMRKVKEAEHKGELVRGMMSDIDGGNGKHLDQHDSLGREQESAWKKWTTLPLGSFEYMAHRIDINHLSHDGWFYKTFVTGEHGVMQAESNYLRSYHESISELQTQTEKILGMSMEKLAEKQSAVREDCGVTIQPRDRDGMPMAREELKLSQAEATYLYMVWQMPDGKAKMMHEGYDEISIAEIEEFIGDKNCEWADWVQGIFLPSIFKKYNAKYLEIYGTPMKETENYVPLRYNPKDIAEKPDLSGDRGKNETLQIKNGSMINRTVNFNRISQTQNAFTLIADHVNEAEEFIAFANLRNDLNAIMSSKAVKAQLNDNVAGQYRALYDAAEIACHANKYQSTHGIDDAMGKISKGLIGANIAFRNTTALKQILSVPAFLGYSQDPRFIIAFLKNVGMQYGANAPAVLTNMASFGFSYEHMMKRLENDKASGLSSTIKWCFDNVPSFRDRVAKGNMGMEIMNVDLRDAGKVQKFLDKYLNQGMTSNKLIDAITCAIGIKSIFDYKMARQQSDIKKQYLSPEEEAKALKEAERIAMTEAEIYYNGTQQSNHVAFMSPVQLDRSAISRMLSVYQNASIGFARKCAESVQNLRKAAHVNRLIDTYTRENLAEGMDAEEASRKAKKDVWNSIRKSAVSLAMYGIATNLIWDLGSRGLLGLFQNDEEKDKALDWPSILSYPMRGMPAMNIGSNLVSGAVSVFRGESPQMRDYNPFLFFSEISGMFKEFGRNGFTPETAINVMSRACKIAGVNPEIWVNTYLGIEDMVKNGLVSGKDVDVMTDVILLLQTPNSNRKNVAKTIFGEDLENLDKMDEKERTEKLTKYLDTVVRAMKYVDEGDWHHYLPGMKTLTAEKKEKLYRELIKEVVPEDIQNAATKELKEELDQLKTTEELSKRYDTEKDPAKRVKIAERLRKQSLKDDDSQEDVVNKILGDLGFAQLDKAKSKDQKTKEAYAKLATSADIKEDAILAEAISKYKENYIDVFEAMTDPDDKKEWMQRNSDVLRIYKQMTIYRTRINKMKSTMTKADASTNKSLMENIRKIRKAALKDIAK